MIGFIDDYIKIFKKNKEGLAGRFKILGQVGLGLIVGLTLYLSNDVVIRYQEPVESIISEAGGIVKNDVFVYDEKSTKTTIPFVKNHEFDSVVQ